MTTVCYYQTVKAADLFHSI